MTHAEKLASPVLCWKCKNNGCKRCTGVRYTAGVPINRALCECECRDVGERIAMKEEK